MVANVAPLVHSAGSAGHGRTPTNNAAVGVPNSVSGSVIRQDSVLQNGMCTPCTPLPSASLTDLSVGGTGVGYVSALASNANSNPPSAQIQSAYPVLTDSGRCDSGGVAQGLSSGEYAALT